MGRSYGLALAASLLTAAGLSVVADAKAVGCITNKDCKGGRVCVAGECTSPSAPSCGSDKDCPGQQICAGGSCVAAGAAPVAPPPASSAPPVGSAPPAGTAPPAGSAPPVGSVPPAGTAPPAGSPPPAGSVPPAGSAPPGYGYPPPGYPVPPQGYGAPPGSGPPSLGYGSLGYGPPMPPAPETEYNNKALMITGAVLLPVGFVAGMAGGVAMAVLETTQRRGLTDSQMGLVALPIIGGTMLVTGIVFLSIGAPKVPVNPDEQVSPEPAVALEPMIGPGAFGMRGTF